MPKREFLHEWMHRFEIRAHCTLRVWCKAGKKDHDDFNDQHEILQKMLIPYMKQPWSPFVMGSQKFILKFAALGFVNAVEWVDLDGNGRLVYVDWP